MKSRSINGTCPSVPTATSTVGFASIPLPTSNPSQALGTTNNECAASNSLNVTYQVPGSQLVFRKECGLNYPFNDLGRVPMTNMNDCLNMCAMLHESPQSSLGPCIGVAWVFGSKQGTGDQFCWFKYSKGGAVANSTTESAWLV
jgi:hypothetical protein